LRARRGGGHKARGTGARVVKVELEIYTGQPASKNVKRGLYLKTFADLALKRSIGESKLCTFLPEL